MDEKGVETIIDLDVGGTRFRTTRQTLLSDPNSMLSKMFHPESPFSPGMKKDGAYFLDRDPVFFRVILNYLRSGHLDLDCNVDGLLKEASFFGLSGLEAALQNPDLQTQGTIRAGRGVAVSDECKIILEEIKKSKKYRYCIFHIVRTRGVGERYMIYVEEKGDRDASYDNFLNDLQKAGDGECRLGLYDFEYEHQSQVMNLNELPHMILRPFSLNHDHLEHAWI